MFQKEYTFYGKHAEHVRALTAKVNTDLNVAIFNRNMDVLLFSCIVGLVYGRRVEKDNNKDISTTKIFTDTMIKESNNLMHNYEIIMILHNKNNDDIETRLDRAFRYVNKSDEFKEECKEIFNSYVRGGIEILYEKIIGESTTLDEYMANLYEFLEEFNMKYNLADNDIDVKHMYEMANK